MNCAIHTETPATSYCRTCGKAMCANCTRTVRGVVYCEDCIAHRLQDTIPAGAPPAGVVAAAEPAPGTPSPGLAAVLGFIPGVGAMYNGQFTKAFIHVLIFASLVWAADREGFFGIFIPFFIFYMVFDAYKTAHARELGLPLPDPLGLEKMFGVSQAEPAPAARVAPPAAAPGSAGYDPYAAEAARAQQRAAMMAAAQSRPANGPIGAVILIALGVLFLLSNLDIWSFDIGRLWPVILIVVGGWLFYRRWNCARAVPAEAVTPPPVSSEVSEPVQAREER